MFNERPVDEKWVALADELAESAAVDLGAMVVLIAAQEGGKMGICVCGEPNGEETRMMKTLADESISGLLRYLADAVDMMEGKKELRIEFAPGAFDAFEGTQEELQEALAQLRQAHADGTLAERSVRMTDEEVEKLEALMAAKKPTRQ